MWWIISGILILFIIFLLVIVHCAGKNISDDIQKKLDEEQVKAVDDYIRRKTDQ